jgi:AraC-like DNA-binding protein
LLIEIILANISDENFGVKELAKAAGMNYFRLNRKLHSILNKNTSQFIRETRLGKSKRDTRTGRYYRCRGRVQNRIWQSGLF